MIIVLHEYLVSNDIENVKKNINILEKKGLLTNEYFVKIFQILTKFPEFRNIFEEKFNEYKCYNDLFYIKRQFFENIIEKYGSTFLPPEIEIKCIVLGGIVGKSSLIIRYINDEFTNCIPTCTYDYYHKHVKMYEKYSVKFMFLDTSGSENRHHMAKHFYKDAKSSIFVFDLTDYESFNLSIKYFNEIRDEVGQIPAVFLGNKKDLCKIDENIKTKLEEFKEKQDIEYFEVSALTGENIDEAFNYIEIESFINFFIERIFEVKKKSAS